MAENPIGITFLPNAEAAANGPRQAGVEGQGGSDLTQAFKILSLHLPRVLGAAAIAPQRLLTSPGAAGVAASGAPDGGFNPYSAVFASLLQQLTGGAMAPGGGPASLSSLYGDPSAAAAGGGAGDPGAGGSGGSGGSGFSTVPPPNILPGSGVPRDVFGGGPAPDPTTPMPSTPAAREPREPRNRYL